jgi:hypothetical protein
MKDCPRLWAAERQVDGRKQWAREAIGTPLPLRLPLSQSSRSRVNTVTGGGQSAGLLMGLSNVKLMVWPEASSGLLDAFEVEALEVL